MGVLGHRGIQPDCGDLTFSNSKLYPRWTDANTNKKVLLGRGLHECNTPEFYLHLSSRTFAFRPLNSFHAHIDGMSPAAIGPSHGSSATRLGSSLPEDEDEVEPLDGELVNHEVNFRVFIDVHLHHKS